MTHIQGLTRDRSLSRGSLDLSELVLPTCDTDGVAKVLPSSKTTNTGLVAGACFRPNTNADLLVEVYFFVSSLLRIYKSGVNVRHD